MDKNTAYTNTTDAELEAQFNERNSNLRKNFGQLVDKIDEAANKTQDYLNKEIGEDANALSSQTNNAAISNDRTSNILNQANKSKGSLIDYWDAKAMNSIRDDIKAMHSLNPEDFELIAPKMDETFGHNALV
ncbi:hypothetical protein BDF20DRAFT_561595 [Mycotypha africana]|uniref:uncharacterized protein n=1 Tax=Mycotypha africana TaxID=64632 RepID=UPI0023017C0C|nr:uncharacterized protein BDF20DRAFT_561595 [Mycotypha africana]KAI8977350.1 hypothetical protein BDF20DRAFT_561595 [Mycotypha africana]